MAVKFSGNFTMTGAMSHARGWAPDILSPAFWFDANASDTLTLGTADVVDQMDDRSGNGLIGTAQSPQADVNKMTYQATGLNGKPALYSDGTNYQSLRWDAAVSGGPNPPTTRTVFIVHQWEDLTGTIRHFMAQSDDFHAPTSGTAYFGNLGDAFAYNGTGRIDGTAVNMTTVQRQLTPVVFQMTLSGAAEFHGMSGGTPDFPTRTYKGWWSEVVAFENVMASGDIERVEGYLAHKWGLADNLPATHPYKSAPPTLGALQVSLDPAATQAGITLSNNNLTATKTGADAWETSRATFGRVTGKFAFEVTSLSEGVTGGIAGIGPETQTGYVGDVANEYGLRADGRKFSSGSFVDTGIVWRSTDPNSTVMFLVDMDNGSISALIGGVTTQLYTFTPGLEFFPALSVFDQSPGPDALTINFGDTPFVETLPAEYSAWNGA